MSGSTVLSGKLVESAKPKIRAYRLHDARVPGLSLRVFPSGVKSWSLTWSRNRETALGKWPGVTLESARVKARAKLTETDEYGAPLAVLDAAKSEGEKPLTFGEFVAKHYAPWALSHQKRGQATLDGIRACFGYLDDKLLTDLCAFDIERFKSARLRAGKATTTVNRDLDRIRGALSRAVDWGMLPAHPLRSVKRARGEDNSRVRYLTRDEEQQLRSALDAREQLRREARGSGNAWLLDRGIELRRTWPVGGFTDHLMPLVVLAMNTGCRRGELFGLEWRSVNLETALLTIIAGNAKSRKTRYVPLNTEAVSVLERWRAQCRGVGLVFPNPAGVRFGNINKAWTNLMVSAGLSDFRFHDLRHDFASKLVMAGVDLNTVRELLGHADIAMTLRYSHLAPQKLADAVAKLGSPR